MTFFRSNARPFEPDQMNILQREIMRNLKIAEYYRRKIKGLLDSNGNGDIRKRLRKVMQFGG